MGNTCQCCPSRPPVISPSRHKGSPVLPIAPSSSLTIPTTSTSSPPHSADGFIQTIEQFPLTDQINPLIDFIEFQLQRIKGSSEEAPSSSPLTSAAQFINAISTEAKNLVSEDIAKEMGELALSGLKKVGKAHWLFLGLSVAAHALERCATVTSNASNCIELLQAIVDLAKDLKRFKEVMPDESERLCRLVQIIVEGAVMCTDYINKGRLSRYCSATTIEAQLKKTNESIKDITSSLAFTAVVKTAENTKELVRASTKHWEESPDKLLIIEPVGINKKIAEVEALLDMGGTEPALAVVLCGLGGVGKSTLAASVIKDLYQNQPQTCADFKWCRVIIDDKSADETSHIMKLQQDIIFDFGGGKQYLRNLKEGHRQILDVLENKKCLLFIDNVVDKKHVQMLLTENGPWLNKSTGKNISTEKRRVDKQVKQKLRILVTSREKNLRTEFSITCKEYDVHAFSAADARDLLKKTILEPDGKFTDEIKEEALMNDVADACRGVPILLTVFGKHLRVDRNPATYKDALKALSEGNPDGFAKEENLRNQLLFVYSKLDKEEQDAFLDICKYFYGWEWELVCKILDEATVKTLQSKMLINKSDSGVVNVHDILRLMGENEGKQTRVSNYSELKEVLDDGERDLKTIKGISLLEKESLTTLESKRLEATSQSLRVLMIGDWVEFVGPPCNRAFKNLRYLRVGDATGFPFEDPCQLHNLRVFFNRSRHGMNLHQLPESLMVISHQVADPDCHSFETLPLQNLPSLQRLSLETRKSVKLPKKFRFPASLVDLQLNCCRRLPNKFTDRAALERLILDKCDLEILPKGLENLMKLKHLSMEHCTKLTSLPEELGHLSSMTCLRLRGCTLLQKLPDHLEKLSALEELNMAECESLRELPSDFGRLSSLRKLDLTGCISLKTLPESFAELQIESLTLESLLSLDELPESIGSMRVLTHLKLISCNSLRTLPISFVHLKRLETLQINNCYKLIALPREFNLLSSLKEMAVRRCTELKELPHGFQALCSLESLVLIACSSLVNLPSGFGELTRLENLELDGLLFSSLPDGFGNLKRLSTLIINFCFKLETLPDDFEKLASLTWVELRMCPNLNGGEMVRVLKLQQCYFADIGRSPKLIKSWGETQEKEKYPMEVCTNTDKERLDNDEWDRAAGAGLLGGNCKELDSTKQNLTERSISSWLEVGTTVAVIAIPVRVEVHHYRLIEQLVDFAKKKENTSSSGSIRIVYVRRVKWEGEIREEGKEEREKEEKEEEKCFQQILSKSILSPVSCAITSSDERRHRLVTWIFFESMGYTADKLACCMVEVDYKDHKFVQYTDDFGIDETSGEVLQNSVNEDEDDSGQDEISGKENENGSGEDEMSEEVSQSSGKDNEDDSGEDEMSEEAHKSSGKEDEDDSGEARQSSGKEDEENKISNSIGYFVESGQLSTTAGRSQSPPTESGFTDFLQILKENNAYHLIDSNLKQVQLDQLKSTVVGVFICDLNTHEYIKLQQIYREVKRYNFEVIWIPVFVEEFYGHGTFRRVSQKMPWTALSNPKIVNVANKNPHCIIYDQEGRIVNRDALSPIMAWGAEAFPFTQSKINEIVSTMHPESILKALFNKIELVNNEAIENKLTFLYAEPPSSKFKMKWNLERLAQLHDDVQIIYVGHFFVEDYDITTFKEVYKDVIQEMHLPKLSFEEMITFWYRCKYFSQEMKDKMMMIELKGIADLLYSRKRWLVVFDSDGVITSSGYEMVKMLCKVNDEKRDEVDVIVENELVESVKSEKCSRIVKTFFKDTVIKHPKHPQHELVIDNRKITKRNDTYYCDSCYSSRPFTWEQQRKYRCNKCDWDLCSKCWELFVKGQVQGPYQG